MGVEGNTAPGDLLEEMELPPGELLPWMLCSSPSSTGKHDIDDTCPDSSLSGIISETTASYVTSITVPNKKHTIPFQVQDENNQTQIENQTNV